MLGALGIALSIGSTVDAQAPFEDWRTIETVHFRVHYPAPAEAWARRAAARLDAIRARLVEEIGHAPAARTDVIVADPIAAPNGFALPWLAGPRIVLFTTAPAADSEIGRYLDWGELLTIHEDAHVVHLTRPSRNPLLRFLERVALPVGPIAAGAPRWAIEGYATMIEGDLTGSGRPDGDVRAALLRRWAQRGQLPTYTQLSGDETRWRGTSMPYLAGSAFFEWLRHGRDDDVFADLWRRASAREARGFTQAFSGVFGAPPDRMYGRFTAELTASALAVERALDPSRRDGALWQQLTWTTGAPALSPDGTRVAVVLRDQRLPSRLVVWSTGPPDAEQREWDARIAETLARDPDDVAPIRSAPLPRDVMHSLPTIDGREPMWPRWMPDGRSLLFVRLEPDAQGVLHPDIFEWTLESGRVARLTRQARVWRPDPAPNGAWAVAVRQQHGTSALVRIDLADGTITPITPASIETAYDHPRVSPDGGRLAYLRLDADGWRLVIRDIDTGTDTVIDTPTGAFLAHPAWSPDGRTLYVSLGQRGLIDVHAVSVDDPGRMRQVTRVDGAAFSPAPSPDGRMFFLALEPHGYDLRVIATGTLNVPIPPLEIDPTLVPAVSPAARTATRWETTQLTPARAYGIGRQEPMILMGGAFAPSARTWEIGLRGGDVIGRLDYLAMASLAYDGRGPQGVAAAAAWRGWPVALGIHAYGVREEPSRQPADLASLDTALDARRHGVEIRADWTRRLGSAGRIDLDAGTHLGEVEPHSEAAVGARAAWARAGYAARPSRGPWHFRYGGSLRLERGRTGDDGWWRGGASAEAGAGHLDRSLRLTWRRTTMNDTPAPVDLIRFGGMDSSVLPRSLLHGRVLSPAFPSSEAAGNRHEMQRVSLARGTPGIHVFYERHRVWTEGLPQRDWLGLAGIEADIDLPPVSLARLPALSLRTGIGRTLQTREDRTRFWFGIAWRP